MLANTARLGTRNGSLKGIFMNKPSPESQSASQFFEWYQNSALILTPKFQRRNVWKTAQKSYLIDTLLRDMPVPPIYLRTIFDVAKSQVVHEVIDGQQRMRAVLDFIEGKYALSKGLDAPYSGKHFSALAKAQQTAILKYRFNCQIFDDITDAEVIEIFRRMNTYTYALNPQELRHGTYFGQFRQSCVTLAQDHLEFWRKNSIVSEARITRMDEVQLTSAILVAQVDGMQDKNTSITEYYDKFDDDFPERRAEEGKFRFVTDNISDAIEDALPETAFRRPPFYYTLHCTVYHRIFGLPHETGSRKTKKRLSLSERESLKDAVVRLSEVIIEAREAQKLTKKKNSDSRMAPYPERYRAFAEACISQTDNIHPRRTRLKTLYNEAFR